MIAALLTLALLGEDPVQHPAFSSNPDEMRKVYATQVKKKTRWDILYGKQLEDLGKVRTPPGLYWDPPRASIMTPKLWAALMGAQDGREYNDSKQFEDYLSKRPGDANAPTEIVKIYADLWAWPGISDWDAAINRTADESEVKNVKFVLLTDDVPPRVMKPFIIENGKEKEVESNYGIPEYNTITGTSDSKIDAKGTSTSSNGTTTRSTGTATVRTASTVTYKTVKAQSATAYNAGYQLVFRIVDADGKPIIRKENKKIIFKVIRPTGEWTVKWNLDQFNRF